MGEHDSEILLVERPGTIAISTGGHGPEVVRPRFFKEHFWGNVVPGIAGAAAIEAKPV
jgi:hypothetical protein